MSCVMFFLLVGANTKKMKRKHFDPFHDNFQKTKKQKIDHTTDEDAAPKQQQIIPEQSVEDLFAKTKQSGIHFDKYDDLSVTVRGEHVPAPIAQFEDARQDLTAHMMQNIALCKYDKPTPVQKHSLPILLAGRDLLSCAQTGSGKTAAYLLPILASILKHGTSEQQQQATMDTTTTSSILRYAYPTAMILAPTRELTLQIANEARKFAHGTDMKVVAIYGGQPKVMQHKKLQEGCDILVCTPGRLCEFIKDELLYLTGVKYFVMDEADKMLDFGFEEQLKYIIGTGKIPKDRQTSMFSATFSKQVQFVALQYMRDYVYISIGRVGQTSEFIKQNVLFVKEADKEKKLLESIQGMPEAQTIIFCRTKVSILHLMDVLADANQSVDCIHGDKEQFERSDTLQRFRENKFRLLLATDVAARGLDIDTIAHVINFDFPEEFESYIHRIGRTGRAGRSGVATTFFNYSSHHFAPNLFKLLVDSKQEVPDWLKTMALNQQRSWKKDDLLIVKEPRKTEYESFVKLNFAEPTPVAEGTEFSFGDLEVEEAKEKTEKTAPVASFVNLKNYNSILTYQFPLFVEHMKQIQLPNKEERSKITGILNTKKKAHPLFVYNMPGDVDAPKMKKFFSPYGNIVKLFLKGDNSNFSRFGFVHFETREQAMHAKDNTDGKDFYGRRLYAECYPDPDLQMIFDPRTVFVSRVPTTVDEDELRKHFQKCGSIVHIFMVKRDYTVHNFTTAFVEFLTPQQAQFAIKDMDNAMFAGSTIFVSQAHVVGVKNVISTTVKVSRYGAHTTSDALKSVFSRCGTIRAIECVNKDDKKRYALVDFEDSWEAIRACWMNGMKLGGDFLKVKLSQFNLEHIDALRAACQVQEMSPNMAIPEPVKQYLSSAMRVEGFKFVSDKLGNNATFEERKAAKEKSKTKNQEIRKAAQRYSSYSQYLRKKKIIKPKK